MSDSAPINKCSAVFLGIIFLFFFQDLFSQTQQNGDWNIASSWTGGVPSATNDVAINKTITIPSGYTARANNLVVGNNGKLVVNGNLIVSGDLEMTNTSLAFEMGEGANVIVYGNFTVKNHVNISLSSFLVVHGNFIKNGGQGTLTIDDANIYIIGAATGWPNSFSCTGEEYQGSTPDVDENCDFGNEQDYEDNQDTFPDELVDLINCYDLSSISATPACSGGSSNLSVDSSKLTNVTFKWQVKSEGSWSDIGNSPSVTVSSIQDFTKEYRVIVRPMGESDCRISISRNIQIERIEGTIWTGNNNSNWNDPANWSCNSLPTLNTDVLIPAGLTNYPVINSGAIALSKNLTIEANAKVTVQNNWLQIGGVLTNSGSIEAESGGVSLKGTARQTLPSGVFFNNLLKNLNIDNPAGVVSQGPLNISNSLKITNGNLETGNDLTMLSDASGTAFIDGSGNGTITGSVKIQRYLASGFGYKYFSSPFSTSVVGDFSSFMELTHPTTSFPHFYTYKENNQHTTGEDLSGWENYTDPAAILSPGRGYAANLSELNNPVTIELEGQVNNGVVTLNLQHNEGYYTRGFHLVGNPYPSPIDWDLVTKNGIDDAAYFFTAGSEDRYTGTYTSYINGVSSNGSSSRIIPSMQGFFVRVSNPGSTGNITFSNAARTVNTNSPAFSQAKNPNMRSKLVLAANFSDAVAGDGLVFYSDHGATYNFDNELDAQKLMNTSLEVPSIYTLTSKQEKLSINAVPGFSGDELMEIPLGINVLKKGKIDLNLKEAPATLDFPFIYLKDKQEKIMWDLKQNAYSLTTQKGQFDDRFSLVFSPDELTENQLKSAFRTFEVQTSSGEIFVKMNLLEGVKAELQLINLSGKILQRKNVSGTEEISFKNLQNGVFLITLRSKEAKETRKILVQQ